jgi:alpha-glucosidase (family GH31 glycosyl hydrolase)
LIITNAADLKDTDFACYTSQVDHSVTMLTATADSTEGAETLTIKTTDGSPIDLGTLKDIHFGTSALDLNLCDISSQYYKVSGDPLDLTGVTTKATLTSLTTKALLPDLELTLTLLETGVVNVHWTYADTSASAPFEVPTDIIQPNKDKVSTTSTLDKFVSITNPAGEGAIAISIMNGATTQIFNLNGMILSQYLNVIDTKAVTKKGSKGILGLFERVSSDLYLPDGVFSLWTFDTANPVESGKPPGNNLYGTHPFYMGQASDDTWFGVFTNLAAAQDWWKKTDNTGANSDVGIVTYAAGGVGDLYFMMGANPNEVTMQYHTIVGLPVVIPQWALGWNQCKWGYNDTDALKAVVQGYADSEIPLDTQWSDIDWMNNYQDFVYDPVNFKDLPDFVNSLHEKNMHYVPIIDGGVAKRAEGYEAYTDGVNNNVFIQVEVNGQNEVFAGQVWPNDAAFPDFFAENTAGWW